MAPSLACSDDFSWLRGTRKAGKPPFLVTRHACFYDCTRGKEGQTDGLPIGLESRGKARYVKQGDARVPCLKLPGKAFLVTRVPFSKNGGGDRKCLSPIPPPAACSEFSFTFADLNQFTITLHVKMTYEVNC